MAKCLATENRYAEWIFVARHVVNLAAPTTFFSLHWFHLDSQELGNMKDLVPRGRLSKGVLDSPSGLLDVDSLSSRGACG